MTTETMKDTARQAWRRRTIGQRKRLLRAFVALLGWDRGQVAWFRAMDRVEDVLKANGWKEFES